MGDGVILPVEVGVGVRVRVCVGVTVGDCVTRVGDGVRLEVTEGVIEAVRVRTSASVTTGGTTISTSGLISLKIMIETTTPTRINNHFKPPIEAIPPGAPSGGVLGLSGGGPPGGGGPPMWIKSA